MKLLKLLLVVVASAWLAGCASVVPQFSDFIYSATLVSSDADSAEVRVVHALDENDVAEMVWVARAAVPVAQTHCESMGKTASGAKPQSVGSGITVFRFRCAAPEPADRQQPMER